MEQARSRTVLCCAYPELIARAGQFGARFGLPLQTAPGCGHSYVLALTPKGLQLHIAERPDWAPICIDFRCGRNAFRRRAGGSKHELLARACGVHKNAGLRIIDATAGWGRDGFLLASLGGQVTLLERSPVVAALLYDAIERARQDPELGELVRQRLEFHFIDARRYLAQLIPAQSPDVIYLDPMFPARTKNALVEKEMRLMHQLIGPDREGPQLLASALNCAKKRVVVKRPRQAMPLQGPAPSMQMTSKTMRFDIYLRNP